MSSEPDHLDAPYEALRAWCHTRPDRDDPSTIYGAFGSITRMIATLTHVVDVAPDSASRATGSDDERSVAEAADEIRSLMQHATCALDDANRAISQAHEIVAHLIFAIAIDGAKA
jgi:hypothetical protein